MLIRRIATFILSLAFCAAVTAADVDSLSKRASKATLTLTKGTVSPDGVARQAYLINGQTPGPQLNFDEGSDVEITVINKLDVELTVHWHGIQQKGSIWSDGVPGITQKLIPPGKSFVYKWTNTISGAYWYHAHSRAIYDDGIRGTIYVRPKSFSGNLADFFGTISQSPADQVKLAASLLSPNYLAVNDWKHLTSEEDLKQWNLTHIEQLCIDSILINGKGQVICPSEATKAQYHNDFVPALTAKGCAFPNNTLIQPYPEARPDLVNPSVWFDCKNTSTPLHVVEVNKADGWASFSVANIGGIYELRISIDGHKLWVYAADGAYHQPQAVDVITLPIGERYSFFVKLDQPTGSYAIRVAANVLPQYITGYAVLKYTTKTRNLAFPLLQDISASSKPPVTTVPAPVNQKLGYGGELLGNAVLLDPLSLKPYPANKPPAKATQTLKFELSRLDAVTWALNHDPYQPFHELEAPLLFSPGQATRLDPDIRPAYPEGSVVDVVFETTPLSPLHPVHKHGTKAWIIGSGPVPFNWTSVDEAIRAVPQYFNLENPPLRDGFNTPPAITDKSFMVIRYAVPEPSLTFMHCHVNAHLVTGMAVVLLEGIDHLPAIPKEYIDANNNL